MEVDIDKQLLKSLTLMGSLIEARDTYTGGHVWRVSQYARRLAEAIGLSSDKVFLVGLGGFLHDIGKIAIPDQILHKRGRLTAAEFEVVKTHPGVGAVLIQEHPLSDLALLAVHQHHEWINGGGYPDMLKGEAISVYGRIVGIVDVFDALTSTRSYRREMTPTTAVEILEDSRGTQFDPQLADDFIALVQEGAFDDIVGHSDRGVPMAVCPTCGPVVKVARETRDGEIGACRVCGIRHRLHRQGDGFAVESLGTEASAVELQPRPDGATIEDLVAQAPLKVTI